MFRKLIAGNTSPASFDWRGFGGKNFKFYSMAFDPYLPDDCQGNNPNFPWNQTDEFIDEPLESKGSDCCEADVKHVDGFMICQDCGHCCEEVIETLEQQYERMVQIKEDQREMEAEARLERHNDMDYYSNI